ncbi:MAG: sigma 54-interacting transcriptional regulator [Polyangiales bacterium]
MATAASDAESNSEESACPSPSEDKFDRILGGSAALAQAVQRARLLAKVTTSVLLQGETGVGKEVFARAIHEGGTQAAGPFVVVSCGGLPRDLLASELFGYTDGPVQGVPHGGVCGKLEAAQDGTLFLDDVLEMPLDLQPYLLRVLEEGVVYPVGSVQPRKVSFRVIAACNRDPWKEVTAGRFRMDLFYRISAASLRIPPLRERMDDVPTLIAHFVREVSQRDGVRPRVLPEAWMSTLMQYAWPGNVRELRNFVEATVLLSADGADALDFGALPALLHSPGFATAATESESAPLGLKRAERDAIGAALRTQGGNLTQVARELRIARSTLYLKVKKYGLDSYLNELRGRSTQ